ncbi:hypothetical protein TNIN_189431 [Trichonephila inaurata madagascariensis]|uniref:Uncharacterized protein n=1 Tax=Trichonephila inaurata madagascariensis TaxID=2747483 RepID=A0A8X6WS55_9ARAC|nr:hypothetical protein TNIN_189431 [Trichonephila inaurata madagascariensis]
MDDLDVALVMYLEDEHSSEESRSEESKLFKNRSEGAFQILVRLHLHGNDEKFRQYFCLTPVLFDYVLNNIRDELTSKPYNRHKKPICPKEKLCILVRHLATGESCTPSCNLDVLYCIRHRDFSRNLLKFHPLQESRKCWHSFFCHRCREKHATVAAVMTIVTTCYFTFRSHPWPR